MFSPWAGNFKLLYIASSNIGMRDIVTLHYLGLVFGGGGELDGLGGSFLPPPLD